MAVDGLDMLTTVPRVASLIYQTHQLWQEFRDVPEEISGLVEHLKAIEPMFSEIEDHFSQDNASAAFRNCLELSRKAYSSLEVLVIEMRKHMDSKKPLKRRYGALKVMLNKPVLDRLEQGLSRCLNLLQLAIQAYQMAMLRKLSSETIATRVQTEVKMQVLQLLPPDPEVKKQKPDNQLEQREIWPKNEYVIQRPKKQTNSYSFLLSKYAKFTLAYTKSTGAWQANIQLPGWLSQSVYEFVSAPAVSGWTFNYCAYNILPPDAEIFAKVEAGDLAGVREMFSTGKASPFDRDPYGNSLLACN